MSYGVALRNGIPFTLGTIAALCVNATGSAWSPRALWPTGTEAGMWIDPSNLASQWQDSTGTTPVSTPGTVADSSNPVGLALDLRLGAPDTLGPELVVNGDFSDGGSGWTAPSHWTFVNNRAEKTTGADGEMQQDFAGAPGKLYEISWDQYTGGAFVLRFGSAAGNTLVASGSGSYVTREYFAGDAVLRFEQSGTTAGDWIDNVSVREIPGNHMLQATSTARPLVSARVNFLQYTEDFGNASWERTGCTITANSTTAPDGTSTADSIVTAGGTPNIYQLSASLPATECTFSIYIKGTGNSIGKAITLMVWYVGSATGTNTFSGETISGDWQRFDIQSTPATAGTVFFRLLDIGNGTLADGDVVYVWGAQAVIGPNAGTYVPVPGAPYPSTGLPIYQKYDGTDDGMATASFAAGTLTSSMDCMIAVRRDSGTIAVAGLNNQVQNVFFGIYVQGETTDVEHQGCGSPTVWVDGVQLAGGTSVKRGTLYDALTAGEWHVLEHRDLDLSTWTQAFWGNFSTTFYINGAQGGILLFPSSTSAADRDAARTWLGAKVGLTL